MRRNKVPEYFVRNHETRAQGIGYLIKLKGPTREAKNIHQYDEQSIILTETKTKELIPRLKIALLKLFHSLIILLSHCFGNYLFLFFPHSGFVMLSLILFATTIKKCHYKSNLNILPKNKSYHRFIV